MYVYIYCLFLGKIERARNIENERRSSRGSRKRKEERAALYEEEEKERKKRKLVLKIENSHRASIMINRISEKKK